MTNRHGSKWITRKKRLAIYLRDGLCCAYCGATMEDGTILTLDHIIPRSCNGGNSQDNLITACRKCNSSRADRPLLDFVESVASYINHGVEASQISLYIQDRLSVDLKPFLKLSSEILDNRNQTFSEVLRGLTQ